MNSRAHASQPMTLKPAESRVGTFVFLLIFALIWNGAAYAYMAPMAIREGGIWPWAFTTLFAALGLVVIVGTIHQGMRLLNPKVEIQLERPSVCVGQTLDLRWRIFGNTRRLENFTLTLEGQEQAEYGRGTRRTTDEHTFAEISLAHIEDSTAMARGQASCQLPARTMHSFDGGNNKITWTLRAHGRIRLWANMNQPFTVTVLPREEASHG